MSILFIIPTYKPAYIYGGPIVVVSLLAESLAKTGHDVTVYTTTANGKYELDVKLNEKIIINGVKVYYFKRLTKDHTHISPGFWTKILRNAHKFDIVHLHSWWNPAIMIAAFICRLKGIKPVLSPHGMFCNYVFSTNHSGAKKYFHSLVGKSLLKNTLLHVSTDMEWKESQLILSGKWRGAIIPNLVELGLNEEFPRHLKSDIFTIGFISRIDPKKGLDILIKALSKVKFEYKLQVAGNGEKEYIESLQRLAKQCGNADKIEWVGWKNNKEKFEFYASIDLFALTSYNENFGAVVIEALSVGTPVFLSDQVGLANYITEKHLGWVTAVDDVKEVALQLEKAHNDKNRLLTIHKTAPSIIRTDYDKWMLATKYANYYEQMHAN